MIFDRTALFSDAQPITATSFSTNVIDLGANGIPLPGSAPLIRDIGKGTSVPLACRVVENFNNLTSLTISIETASDAAFTTPVQVFTSPAYSLADVSTAKRYLLPDSIPIGVNQRYMRLKYTVAGTAPTTGKITAGVTMANQTNATL
jgi:hypothetical protein